MGFVLSNGIEQPPGCAMKAWQVRAPGESLEEARDASEGSQFLHCAGAVFFCVFVLDRPGQFGAVGFREGTLHNLWRDCQMR